MKQNMLYKLEKLDEKLVIVDKNNLAHNYKIIKNRAGISKIISVIKGDSYGHGMVECSRTLYQSGTRDFYLARLEDAIKIRKENYKNTNIYLLSGTISKNVCKKIKDHNITPIINNLQQLEILDKYSNTIKYVLHFDTGMNRLGFKFTEIEKIKNLSKDNQIKFIMTHLSSADEKNLDECRHQLKQIKKINSNFNKKLSIANSSGIFLGKSFHLNYVRPGKSLYGINPFFKKSFGLKGVMSIFAPILQIASLPKGQTVGYGKTYKTKKVMKVATIDFGYSDGYFRSGSNNAKVFIDGRACRIIGRVSMDLITIDVSNIEDKNLYLGKAVEILGNNQSCEDLAIETRTNEHEILISLGKNSKKVYI